MNQQTKGWPTRALDYFLTYPRCNLTPAQVMQKMHEFRTLQGRELIPVKQCIVAQEEHKPDEKLILAGNHIHVWIKFAKRVQWSNTFFDLHDEESGQMWHGNYQVCRNPTLVRRYVTKENNYELFGITIDDIEGTSQATKNRQMLTTRPRDQVDEGSISLMKLPQLLKAIEAYDNTASPYESETTRGVWIAGKPGAGKTWKAIHDYGESYYFKDISATGIQWFSGYKGEHVIICDEVEPSMAKYLGYYLKRWADKYQEQGQIKGGSVNLQHRKLVCTSNYSMDEVFGFEPRLLEALDRRFERISMSKKYVPEPVEATPTPFVEDDRLFPDSVNLGSPPILEKIFSYGDQASFNPLANSFNCFETLNFNNQ